MTENILLSIVRATPATQLICSQEDWEKFVQDFPAKKLPPATPFANAEEAFLWEVYGEVFEEIHFTLQQLQRVGEIPFSTLQKHQKNLQQQLELLAQSPKQAQALFSQLSGETLEQRKNHVGN